MFWTTRHPEVLPPVFVLSHIKMPGVTAILVTLYIVSVAWHTAEASYGSSTSGPYVIKIMEIKECPDKGTGQMYFGTKINNKGKGVYTYSENFTIGVPIDEHFKGYIEVQEWGNGGYKPRSIEYTAKNCEDIWKFMDDYLKKLMKSAGVTIDKCPVPKGNYTAKDMVVHMTFNNIPTMKYNKYRLLMDFYYKDVKVGCQILYTDIVEKKQYG